MKRTGYLIFALLLFSIVSFSGTENTGEIKLLRYHSEINPELRDILRFMNVDYLIVDFTGNELEGKSYRIMVSEIWEGEITNTATIFNSAEMPEPHLREITSDAFQFRVVSELTGKNTLRMHFNFPGLTVHQEYNAIQSDDYSLRHAHTQPETPIHPGEKFYLLTYILPYEEDGVKRYCTIETSGSDIHSWGEEFGIEHYLVFEMVFDK